MSSVSPDTPLRVLYVCADRAVPLLGNEGAAVHIRSITAALAGRGHHVTVAVAGMGAGNPPPEVHRVVGIDPAAGSPEDVLHDLIRSEQIDVVIERHSLESGAARTASSWLGVPLVLEVNAPLAAETGRLRALVDDAARRRARATVRGADHVYVVSRALVSYVRSVATEVPCTWIPNGADVELFRSAVREEVPEAAGRLVVGFVGSMEPWHGVEELVDAFAMLSRQRDDVLLLLVGGGPLEEPVRAQVGALGLSGRVRQLGAVPHARVPGLVKAFDVAAAPYAPADDFYSGPITVVEYLAGGCPVVYSDQGDLQETVGNAGVGFPPGDAGALARVLFELVEDAERRATLAAAAPRRADSLPWDAAAGRVLAVAAAVAGASAQERRPEARGS